MTETGKRRFWRHCMVAHAVAVERVSATKFPANREKNRDFCRIVVSGTLEAPNSRAATEF